MSSEAESPALHKPWNPGTQELEDGGPEVRAHLGYIVDSKPAQEGHTKSISKTLGVYAQSMCESLLLDRHSMHLYRVWR